MITYEVVQSKHKVFVIGNEFNIIERTLGALTNLDYSDVEVISTQKDLDLSITHALLTPSEFAEILSELDSEAISIINLLNICKSSDMEWVSPGCNLISWQSAMFSTLVEYSKKHSSKCNIVVLSFIPSVFSDTEAYKTLYDGIITKTSETIITPINLHLKEASLDNNEFDMNLMSCNHLLSTNSKLFSHLDYHLR